MSTQKFTGLALAVLLVAGCGGSSNRVSELETELEETQTALDEATAAAKEAAEAAKRAAAEAEKAKTAEAEAKRQAEEQQKEEAAKLAEAERKAQEALDEAEEAKRQGNLRQRIPALHTALRSDATFIEETVTVSHKRGESRKLEASAFYTPGSTAPGISGWHSRSFTRDTATHEDTIYLYTNIQAPGTKAFWKRYGLDAVTMSNDNEGLARPGSKSTTTVDGSEVTTAGGSFDGVGGKFSCSGGADACTFSRDGNTYDFTAGTWTFEATNLKSGVPLEQDETYLHFGIWLHHPKDAAGTSGVRWIAGGGAQGPGNTPTTLTSANFGALEGIATFAGGAVGQYAIDKTSVDGQAKTGTFTAKAMLQANFGTDTDGGSGNQLSGRITDFREGDSSLAGWNMYLQGADSNTPATLAATGVTAAAGVTTSGTIDGVAVTGTWAARLYGVDNMTAPDDVQCPNGCEADVAGVSGWFRAQDSIGNIVSIGGAFGAQKQ